MPFEIGYLYNSDENFDFIFDNKGAIITQYVDQPTKKTVLEIPGTLHRNGDSVNVYKIGDDKIGNIFKSNVFYPIERIIIDKNIKCVFADAFANSRAFHANKDGVIYIDNVLCSVDCDIEGDYYVEDNTRIIAEDAFYLCEDIKKIYIPNSVENICNRAFSYCASLTDIFILGNPTVEDGVFENIRQSCLDGDVNPDKVNIHCKPGTHIYRFVKDHNMNVAVAQSKLSDFLEKTEQNHDIVL